MQAEGIEVEDDQVFQRSFMNHARPVGFGAL